MKKTLVLLLIITSFSLSAQTNKGSFMIGGTASFTFQKSQSDGMGLGKGKVLSASPQVSYFFIKNFSVGLSFPLSRSWHKYTTSYNPQEEFHTVSYSTGLGPVVRYYFPVKNFFIIAQGSYGWYYTKSTYDTIDPVTGTIQGSDERSTKNKGYSLAAGPAFFLSPYTSIEILATYRDSSYDNIDNSIFDISVGLQIYLPKNPE